MREVGKLFSESKKRSFGPPLMSKIIMSLTQNKSMSGENVDFSHKVEKSMELRSWTIVIACNIRDKARVYSLSVFDEAQPAPFVSHSSTASQCHLPSQG